MMSNYAPKGLQLNPLLTLKVRYSPTGQPLKRTVLGNCDQFENSKTARLNHEKKERLLLKQDQKKQSNRFSDKSPKSLYVKKPSNTFKNRKRTQVIHRAISTRKTTESEVTPGPRIQQELFSDEEVSREEISFDDPNDFIGGRNRTKVMTLDDCNKINNLDRRKRTINAVLQYKTNTEQWDRTIKSMQGMRDRPKGIKVKKIHNWQGEKRTLIETSKHYVPHYRKHFLNIQERDLDHTFSAVKDDLSIMQKSLYETSRECFDKGGAQP